MLLGKRAAGHVDPAPDILIACHAERRHYSRLARGYEYRLIGTLAYATPWRCIGMRKGKVMSQMQLSGGVAGRPWNLGSSHTRCGAKGSHME